MEGLPPFVEGPAPNMDSPAVIYSDYFLDLTDMLTEKFPLSDVGVDRGFVFHSDYVIPYFFLGFLSLFCMIFIF